MNTLSKKYKKIHYPKKIIKILYQLESCSEDLENLLESYRYLQPKGGMFSAKNIEKIFKIHELAHQMAEHDNAINWHKEKIVCLQYEKDCLEKGIKPKKEEEKFLDIP